MTIDTQLPYSPRLKEIMAEIKALLQPHDIAAYVILHEPGYSEYLHSISPTWSIIRMEEKGLRLRSNLEEDYAGDQQAQKLAHNRTANLVCHFVNILENDANIFKSVKVILDKHWHITSLPGTHTPHRNN